MTFLVNITNKKNTLTKNELIACDRILENLASVQMLSLTKMAEEIHTSKTTILRFCQKVGYSGFTEFRYACIRYINSLNDSQSHLALPNYKIQSVQESYIQTIQQLDKTIRDEDMILFAKKISEARIIRCVGEVNSSVTCYQLRYALAMYGYNVDVITNAADVTSIDLASNEKDLVILISARASTKSNLVKETMRLVENCGSELVVVTMNSLTDLASMANIVIALPNVVTLKSDSLLHNVPIFSVFVEILLNYL